MEENKESFLTVGVGTGQERKIKIINFIQAYGKDNRVISVSELENEEGYLLSVENIPSTGRATQSSMWVSKDSFLALMATQVLFWECKGEDMTELLKASTVNGQIDYRISEGLKLINQKEE